MTWTTPTALNYVTSPFNLLRMHPKYRVPMPHTGTDYRAPTGTPLRAATAGTVVRSVPLDPRAGNYIRIQWGGPGDWIGYSHLSRRDVGVGQRVGTGQVIGLSGATGAVAGAHLHFEVSVSGVKVDPVPFLAAQIELASRPVPTPKPIIPTPGGTLPAPLRPEDDDMRLIFDRDRKIGALLFPSGLWQTLTGDGYQALKASGVQAAELPHADFAALTYGPNQVSAA
jgi:hypothetical protein